MNEDNNQAAGRHLPLKKVSSPPLPEMPRARDRARVVNHQGRLFVDVQELKECLTNAELMVGVGKVMSASKAQGQTPLMVVTHGVGFFVMAVTGGLEEGAKGN